ncbi:MAG TPA: DUF2293 domain-containing protein [Spirochaetota bacterium]|nr:DUF2293 domain-containing protein [Spirochaetota bacterium]
MGFKLEPNDLIEQKGGILTDRDGNPAVIPGGWVFLPAGDAVVTRKTKAAGSFFVVRYRHGRKWFSKGIWADADIIEMAKKEVNQKRSTEDYKRRSEQVKKYRQKKEQQYAVQFEQEIAAFLNFASVYKSLQDQLSKTISEYVVPVGSGTVARTKMIPIEKRAESAVIAWLRHNITEYDNMAIPRQKGVRREIRRSLARASRDILEKYRKGEEIPEHCPLKRACRGL